MKKYILLTSICSLATLNVLAVKPEPIDSVNLETVVVTGTRTPKLLKNTPIVTRVITSSEIKKIDATNIGELLQTELPGIEFSYSMNQQISLNLQGFGGNSVLFLKDGERLAGETLDNIDYSRLNMENVDRVEIVKGAASALYGSNAVGGVINIISSTATKPWTANINSRFGAYNEQRYGGSLSLKTGIFNSVTNIQKTSIDAIKLKNSGDFNEVFGNRSWNFNERLLCELTKNIKLTARTGYFFRERDASAVSKDRYRDYSAGLKGNYDIDNQNDVELAYSFDQYDKSSYIIDGSKDIRNYSNVQNSLRALYNHTFSNDYILTLGGDAMRDYLMSYQFEKDGHKKQNSYDGFIQMDLSPLKYFNMIGGIRYDYYSNSGTDRLSGKLGMMYKIGNMTWRASYAGGFRAPTLKEMYMNFDMANIFMIYGNSNLKPETSHNFMLSTEYVKHYFSFNVSSFYNILSNKITTAWNQGLKGMLYTNIANMRIAGFNADISSRLPCGVSGRLSYAYTYEHIKKGEPLTSSTRPHAATLKLEYDKKWRNYGFDIFLTGRYMSRLTADEYISSISYTETEKKTYPGYSIWRLSIIQHIKNSVDVNMTVDNLFNYVPSYYSNNSPTTRGAVFSVGVSVDIDKLVNRPKNR